MFLHKFQCLFTSLPSMKKISRLRSVKHRFFRAVVPAICACQRPEALGPPDLAGSRTGGGNKCVCLETYGEERLSMSVGVSGDDGEATVFAFRVTGRRPSRGSRKWQQWGHNGVCLETDGEAGTNEALGECWKWSGIRRRLHLRALLFVIQCSHM